MEYRKIIELITIGKDNGLKLLYEEYGSKLYSFSINNWKNSEDDSWELVYSTLLKVISALDKYEIKSENHFKNWIYKIFKNEFLQLKRKEKRRNMSFSKIDIALVDNYTSDDDWKAFGDDLEIINNDVLNVTDIQSNAKTKNLELALSKLNDDERNLLMLKAQNFTYKEIASFMKVNHKDLKVKHFRAKKKLIKIYNNQTENHGSAR